MFDLKSLPLTCFSSHPVSRGIVTSKASLRYSPKQEKTRDFFKMSIVFNRHRSLERRIMLFKKIF